MQSPIQMEVRPPQLFHLFNHELTAGILEENATNAIWDIIQMASTIICCCAPAYKNFLPKSGFWKHLGSRLALYSGRIQLRKSKSGSRESGSVYGIIQDKGSDSTEEAQPHSRSKMMRAQQEYEMV